MDLIYLVEFSERLFTQMASLCGTFSHFQSGPKPELAEFGNRAATNRSIIATAAHITSAIRSRPLIGAYGQIISLSNNLIGFGSTTPCHCQFPSIPFSIWLAFPAFQHRERTPRLRTGGYKRRRGKHRGGYLQVLRLAVEFSRERCRQVCHK